MIAAVVPVKAVDASKSRLRDDFDAATVERLATALLRDVLAALTGARSIDRVVVATPDVAVARVAREAGADTIVRDDPGLNAAVERAAADLAAAGADAVLVMLGDVAGARSEDVDRLVAALSGDGVALAPARDGGTAALLLRPHDVIATGFGPDSAAKHRELASRAAVRLAEIRLPSLAIDVDRRDDLEALLASDAPATHTRAAWRTLAEGNARD
jgi:2-phospho-L-lactate guanylyltransferase